MTQFLELARSDAAVQERLKDAVKQSEPIAAMLQVASAAGFDLTAEDLQAVFNAEVGEESLERLSGGSGASPAEWFAEAYSIHTLNRPRRDS